VRATANTLERALDRGGLQNARMRKVALIALKGLCWALSAVVVVAAFGASMVWVTGWLFGLIVDGGHGWKDTTARVFGALIAAPVAGIAAGVVAGVLVGAPLYGLLRLIGVHDPLRRRPRGAAGRLS
jgi:hypothetical protein